MEAVPEIFKYSLHWVLWMLGTFLFSLLTCLVLGLMVDFAHLYVCVCAHSFLLHSGRDIQAPALLLSLSLSHTCRHPVTSSCPDGVAVFSACRRKAHTDSVTVQFVLLHCSQLETLCESMCFLCVKVCFDYILTLLLIKRTQEAVGCVGNTWRNRSWCVCVCEKATKL